MTASSKHFPILLIFLNNIKCWRGVTTYGTGLFYFCGMSYEDIINLPHHVSKRHPQMSMKKRAAQFAPFAAMEGYKESIEESIRQNEKLYEPKFDDDWWD